MAAVGAKRGVRDQHSYLLGWVDSCRSFRFLAKPEASYNNASLFLIASSRGPLSLLKGRPGEGCSGEGRSLH